MKMPGHKLLMTFLEELNAQSILIKIWLFFILFTGLILTLLVPPLQKPDEYVHFNKAVILSNGFFSCSFQENAKIQDKYSTIPATVDKYGVTQNYAGKFYYGEYLQPIFEESNSFKSISTEKLCGLPSISYIFQSFGLLIADVFNFNGIVGFYLGRLIPFMIFFLVLIYCVLRSNESSKVLFLSFASIPVVLQQVGSYGYDSIQLILGLGLFFQMIRLFEVQKIPLRQIVLFLLFLVALHLTKSYSYLLFFLLPLLFIEKIEYRHSSIQSKLSLLILIFFIGYSLFRPFIMFASHDLQSFQISPIDIQREIFVSDPLKIFEVLLSTLEQEFKFYLNSTIGNLGWLDYILGESSILLYVLLIGYACSKFTFKNQIKYIHIKILLICAIIFGSLSLIIIGMFLGHTPTYFEIGSNISYGTQGRYFLLQIPLCILLIGLIKQSKIAKVTVLSVLFIFLSFKLTQAVFLRYYDYRSLYDVTVIVPEGDTSSDNYLDDKQMIDSLQRFEYSIEKSKSLKGVTIGPVFTENGILMPYTYKIFNSGCENPNGELEQGLVTKNNIQSYQVVILFEKPLNKSEQVHSTLCLELAPYKQNMNLAPNITFVYLSQNPEVFPIYLR